MVKSLGDICLGMIQSSLDVVPNIGNFLPTVFKEVLIERLVNHDQLSVGYLPYISYNLFTPSLRHVTLYKCEQVTDGVLKLMSQAQCKLDTICINTCVNVTDKGVSCITKNQNKLSVLKLQKLRAVTGKGLEQVRSDCLETVNLKDCYNVTFEGVRKLVESNPTIKVLKLGGIDETSTENICSGRNPACKQARDVEIIRIASCLGFNLEEFDSHMTQFSDDGLEALANNCPNLQRLNLHGSSRISGKALIKLSIGCTKLESLDLSYCRRICEQPGCSALWTLPTSLTELSLCGVLLNDEAILVECFQRLRHLKAVRLCGVKALNDNTLRQILKHVGQTLTSLDISGGIQRELTDEGLTAIVDHCFNLENLSLLLLHGITAIPLIPLFKDQSRASKIKKLFLSVRELEAEVLSHIHVCHNLELLDLSGLTCVTDDLLTRISENCLRLTDISLKGCRQVTDNGVCKIVRCCRLKSLVLAGIHNLTDKSIFALANSCPYLEAIYLNGCAQISPAAVRYLVDCCIPRLFVKHATPNARPDQLMARNLDTGEFCRADLITFDYSPPSIRQ